MNLTAQLVIERRLPARSRRLLGTFRRYMWLAPGHVQLHIYISHLIRLTFRDWLILETQRFIELERRPQLMVGYEYNPCSSTSASACQRMTCQPTAQTLCARLLGYNKLCYLEDCLHDWNQRACSYYTRLLFSDENLAAPIQNELPWRIEILFIRFLVEPELIKPFSIEPGESISVPVSIRDYPCVFFLNNRDLFLTSLIPQSKHQDASAKGAKWVEEKILLNGEFGSLAVVQNDITRMSAFGCIADTRLNGNYKV